MEAKFGSSTRFSEANFGTKPPTSYMKVPPPGLAVTIDGHVHNTSDYPVSNWLEGGIRLDVDV